MSEAEEQLKTYIKSGQKIQAIKFLRAQDGIGLKEAKQRVEELQRLMQEAGEIDASLTGKSGCAALLLFSLLGVGSLLIF